MPAARERIQRSSSRRAGSGACVADHVASRPPALQPRVGREEGQHVPEHQQLAPSLVGGVVAEEDVVLRSGARVHPAHDVHAHALGRLVELDGVAPRLVHGPAVLAVERGVAEDGLEGRLVAQHRAHGQHGVEPVAELAREGLRDEVGREPLLPVVGVRAEVQRAEGHDAGVQPGVAHVADAPRLCPARPARHDDPVHPGPVRRAALEQLEAGRGPHAQLLPPADDLVGVAGGALPDGQRQAPVALLGDRSSRTSCAASRARARSRRPGTSGSGPRRP